jgi:tripartite-type tricarboxylate transporter receptor subunit TctC
MMFTSPLAVSQQVKGGKLVAVAIASAKRTESWPELATVAESGVPGYSASLWYGLLAPARTPEAAIRALEALAMKAAKSPDLRDRFAQQAVDPIGSDAREFQRFLQSELSKWSSVVRTAKIRIE